MGERRVVVAVDYPLGPRSTPGLEGHVVAKTPEAPGPLDLSRRSFLGWCASAALVPTRLRAAPFALLPSSSAGADNAFADYRLTPHYRAQPRLAEILRKT